MYTEDAFELVSEVLAHSYQPELKGRKNKKALEDARKPIRKRRKQLQLKTKLA